MRTLHMFHMRCIPKNTSSKCSKIDCSYLQRIRSFLLRDVLPLLVMVIILSICALFVAEKIYQAKASRTVNMVEGGSQPKPPPPQ
ncbi:hypothetical protein [Trichloromonas sp.]|uniref:hypothetical protein n=1 Tax=Trichloromonas sp. TaxID=3069249 RepID=UPI003D813E9C